MKITTVLGRIYNRDCTHSVNCEIKLYFSSKLDDAEIHIQLDSLLRDVTVTKTDILDFDSSGKLME